MQENLPKIGETVQYHRADQGGVVYSGSGIVQAIFAGADRRLMVQVRDGETTWNCDAVMINPTPEQVVDYTAAIVEVQQVSEEGNQKVKEIVEDYNKRVEAIYERVLGGFVDLEPLPVAKAEDGEDIAA